MFSRNSRYANVPVYPARLPMGQTVNAVRLPIRARPATESQHARDDSQRPDLIAAHYLDDATAFWRLCDAGGAVAPDALAARERIAIPVKGR